MGMDRSSALPRDLDHRSTLRAGAPPRAAQHPDSVWHGALHPRKTHVQAFEAGLLASGSFPACAFQAAVPPVGETAGPWQCTKSSRIQWRGPRRPTVPGGTAPTSRFTVVRADDDTSNSVVGKNSAACMRHAGAVVNPRVPHLPHAYARWDYSSVAVGPRSPPSRGSPRIPRWSTLEPVWLTGFTDFPMTIPDSGA